VRLEVVATTRPSENPLVFRGFKLSPGGGSGNPIAKSLTFFAKRSVGGRMDAGFKDLIEGLFPGLLGVFVETDINLGMPLQESRVMM
jgi:hypothetical protein